MRIPKSKVLYVSVAAAAVLGSGAVCAEAAYKTVTVQDNGQRKVIRGFTMGNLNKFMAVHGISVNPEDQVSPDLSSAVKDGMTVVITHPATITLVDGETTSEWQSFAHNVGEFLRERGVQVSGDDTVNLSSDTALTNGLTIQITRTDKKVSTKTQDIPFQTIRQRTDKLYVGQQRVLTHGVKGSMQIETTSVFVNGHKVKDSVHKKVLKSAVNEVIQVGTQPRPVTISARGIGSLVVHRQITVVATAYAAGGHTATGVAARPGVIAVDPNVIPLGTRLYIPGIGIVRAEDTGGAIRGNRIDICVANEATASQWGVRTVTIYEIQ